MKWQWALNKKRYFICMCISTPVIWGMLLFIWMIIDACWEIGEDEFVMLMCIYVPIILISIVQWISSWLAYRKEKNRPMVYDSNKE